MGFPYKAPKTVEKWGSQDDCPLEVSLWALHKFLHYSQTSSLSHAEKPEPALPTAMALSSAKGYDYSHKGDLGWDLGWDF